MLALLASIAFNIFLGVIFRWFKSYRVQNLPAIVVNYVVAALLALLLTSIAPGDMVIATRTWLLPALGLGLLFVLGFSTVAATIQHYGLGLTAVFQKVSLVITSLFAIVYFQEIWSWHRVTGTALAILAIIMINRRTKRSDTALGRSGVLILMLPFLTFFFNGTIDTLLYYLEKTNMVQAGNFHFIASIFLSAAVFGTLVLLYQVIVQGLSIKLRDILGGIVLGIPNFFSIHFFLMALGSGYDGSVVVPVNNAGIILGSALLGMTIFREFYSRINLWGIVTAILAIILLTS